MKYKYIIIALVVVILLGSLVTLVFSPKTPTGNQSNTSPTPAENGIPQGQRQPTPTIGEDKNVEKELNLLENRQPLTASDADVRKKLINSAGPDGESLHITEGYAAKYIAPADEFQVEIDSTNTAKAK